jgi:hypothetical protein
MKKSKREKKPKVEATPQAASQMPISDPKQEVSARMLHIFGQELLRNSKLPVTQADKPCVVMSPKDEVMILNSMLIGSLTAEDEATDIVRNALKLADLTSGAVFVTGDLIYMITQRYGNQRPYKTQVSGVRVDAKKVQSSYPKSVVGDKDFESVESRLNKGEPVFMTLQMRLEHTLDMLADVFTNKNGKPVFSGPVYITFGKLEDELVMFYTNELLRVGVFKTRAWAQKRILQLTSQWRKERDEQKRKELYSVIREFKEFLNIFAIMGNVSDESIDEVRRLVTGYIIRKYEARIPNAKVVSIGDAFLRVGSHQIMATTDKIKEAGAKLSTILAAKTESFSKGRLTTNIPEVMLGTGLNPYLDIKFVTYQASNTPGDERMCMIIQLPVCCDAERYRDVVRNQNILRDNITKFAQKSGFESGVVSLSWCDCLSLPIVKMWTSGVLKNKDVFKDAGSLRDMVNGKKKEHKLIFGHKEGCSHYGASDVLLHDSPDDPNGMYKKYHHQVAGEFLRSCDAPILHHQHDGDATQQMNHPYTKNIHLTYLLPEDLNKKMREIVKSKESESLKLKLLMTLAFEQKVRDGVHDFRMQVEGMVKSLEPNLEYFVKILERSKKANLSFEGWLSAIMLIAGNHNKNTFKNMEIYVSDAEYIVDLLKKMLLAYLIETKRVSLSDLVEKGISSPRYGPLGEGRGALLVDGHPCYNVVLKHKQGSMDKTADRARKRSQEHFEVGLPICNLSGDDHKGGVRVTRGAVHIKTGCQQGEGPFGREIDFSAQNVFSMVYGMPVGGFANGPLVFMVLDYQTMRRYAAKPFLVHRDRLFKNALE